jgi:outer membrane beta-barrel protein
MFKLGLIALGVALLMSKEIKAGEESLYDFLWLDPDKKVYVLQNKLYKKENSFFFDVGYMSNFTSKFQDTQGFQLRGGYYFHEEWGVEGSFQQYMNVNNDEYRSIRRVTGAEPFIRRLRSSYGANLIWSPFYGKINTFNEIFYFDWSFGAGYTKINAESNIKTAAQRNVKNTFNSESYDGGVLKTKVKVHLTESMHVGLEYMNTYYMAPSPSNPSKDKLRTNTDIIISVGFSF